MTLKLVLVFLTKNIDRHVGVTDLMTNAYVCAQQIVVMLFEFVSNEKLSRAVD